MNNQARTITGAIMVLIGVIWCIGGLVESEVKLATIGAALFVAGMVLAYWTPER